MDPFKGRRAYTYVFDGLVIYSLYFEEFQASLVFFSLPFSFVHVLRRMEKGRKEESGASLYND
jgi:hypothetical protein